MKKRSRKKRRIKWKRVIFCIISLTIIVGGIIMYYNNINKNNNEPEKIQTSKPEKIDQNFKEDNIINQTNNNLEKAPLNSIEFNNLEDGEYITEKGYTLKITNKTAYIDGHLIVNKTYNLPEDYKPTNPNQSINGDKCNNCLDKEVTKQFNSMKSAATAIGLNIYISSGYRSYNYQKGLYDRYVSKDGKAKADTYSARPGHSEHQTGLCFDLNTIDDSFANTSEGKWINNNAHLYGFIIRYPKGKEQITGYQYESWHLRYVGVELASKLYNNGNWLTMEEYFGLSSNY